jgi:gamma-glutamyltranspeptidase/glutathione hydrolase
VQVFSALVDDGLDPQSALDQPRFCIEAAVAGSTVDLEHGIPGSSVQDLASRGHTVRELRGWERAVFGRGQIILRDPQTGLLTGGSDLRADGCAMALV